MTMEKSIKPVSISKKDILWSYLSQFLSIGAGILILPAILHKLSSQEIGINYILLSISAFIPLLDAGFSPQDKTPEQLFEKAVTLRSEYVIGVKGTVRSRESKNTAIPTGEFYFCLPGFSLRRNRLF